MSNCPRFLAPVATFQMSKMPSGLYTSQAFTALGGCRPVPSDTTTWMGRTKDPFPYRIENVLDHQ